MNDKVEFQVNSNTRIIYWKNTNELEMWYNDGRNVSELISIDFNELQKIVEQINEMKVRDAY